MGVFGLAFRYLRSRRVALLAVAIIAIGVMSMIVVVSLMDGVQHWVVDHFRGMQADITVTARRMRPDWAELRKTLEEWSDTHEGAIKGISARLTVPGLVVAGKKPAPGSELLLEGIQLIGVDFDEERHVTDFEALFRDVSNPEFATSVADRIQPLLPRDGMPTILLGDSLAMALGVKPDGSGVGEGCITVLPAPSKLDESEMATVKKSATAFRVGGCFSSGRADFDKLFAFVDRRTLRRIRDPDLRGADVSSVHLRLEDPDRSTEVAHDLLRSTTDWEFTSWETARRQDLLALKDQKRIMVVILSFIIGVAALAIMGLVYMMVVEKTRDIGILRSMGLSRTRMIATFTFYGLMIGIMGAILGVVLGHQLARNLDGVVAFISRLTGVRVLDPEVYRFKEIPVRLESGTIFMIFAIAVAMSFFSALVPALKAGLMSPVRCLRSE